MQVESIAKTLGGKKATRTGNGWLTCCPAHDDNTPSLSVSEDNDKLLVHCHSGCGFDSVLSALRLRGLVQNNRNYSGESFSRTNSTDDKKAKEKLQKRLDKAIKIWNESTGKTPSPVLDYLEIYRNVSFDLSDELRIHPSLYHYQARKSFSALIAPLRNLSGEIRAVHCIFIDPETGNKIEIPNVKPKLTFGLMKGNAVQLSNSNPAEVVVTESVEDGLSIVKSCKQKYSVWVGCGNNTQDILLPASAVSVLISTDNDQSGDKYRLELSKRYLREKRRVRIVQIPPYAKDPNELLTRNLINN